MSYAVNQEYLKKLDMFGKGLGIHSTVIKYECLTPDSFLLCFRTTALDGQEHFFAMLEIDHIYTIKYVKKSIKNSFAKVIDFLPPIEKQKGRGEVLQKSVYDADGGMHYFLARTERPTGKGYWATYISIMPTDDVDSKLSDIKEESRVHAKKLVANLIRNNPAKEPSSKNEDFISGWQRKTKNSYKTDQEIIINDTDLGINVFENNQGDWEAVYNYTVTRTPKRS